MQRSTVGFLVVCAVAACGPTDGAIRNECWVSDLPELDTFRLVYEEATGAREFRPPPGASPISHSWDVIEGTDSIRIDWGIGGFVGYRIRARAAADSLSGLAIRFSDEIASDPPQPVPFRAVPSRCVELGGGPSN